ncbi:TIGR04283 family arsenosugar biosynthesis glycosyltransferase [Allohahella marinimesophila]|uniref:TIGR04283 family arsenosugar biosynthesis glycosyltransferase n=1 Tax=Allohahella marinimesophila TaxID=1054972 RepID=A0ABP7NTZ7_9GAMM
MISLIVPTLNEEAAFRGRPGRSLNAIRQAWPEERFEIITVDAASRDQTRALAAEFSSQVIVAPPEHRGRSRQMNLGAAAARGELLVFLHADTELTGNLHELDLFARTGASWGRCRVQLSGSRRIFRVIETMMEWRSRISGVCTGDQVLVIRREVFEHLGGYDAIPLMEDVAISKRLRRLAWPKRLPLIAHTSSRRWEEHGVWRTILLMWRLRLAYFFGASPETLARRYAR